METLSTAGVSYFEQVVALQKFIVKAVRAVVNLYLCTNILSGK